MNTIAIDGLNEDEFRRSIEGRLRCGRPGEAIERLHRLLAPFVGEDAILPPRFLTVSAEELTITGWDGLDSAIQRHDRSGRPVTALGIAFGWPGDDLPVPDANGLLRPVVEVGYYNDDAFPFSKSGRDDLLDGYSYHGCTWASDCEASDNVLGLDGIDDLNGALALLEARLLSSEEPDEDEIRAGSLGACLLSVLLHQAVSDQIKRAGLPRPVCVMAGSNGVYPYFDAPVVGIPEDIRRKAEAAEEDEEAVLGAPAPRYSSLLVTGIRRAPKRAALVLEETEAETAVRISKLRGLAHAEGESAPAPHEVPEDMPILPAAAVIGSPLMTKKPSGQSWDFRDMLSSPPPEPVGFEDEPEGPAEEEPIDDWPSLDEPPQQDPPASETWQEEPVDEEPEEEWPSASLEAAAPDLPAALPATEDLAPRPQFTLFESYLQPLSAPALPEFELELEPEPEDIEWQAGPVVFESRQSQPEPEPEQPAEPLPLTWASGLAWSEQTHLRSEPTREPERFAPPPTMAPAKTRPSLLARLRAWWSGASLD